MKPSLFLFLWLLFCWQCKEPADDLSGKSHLRGRLFLTDKLTQNADGIPLENKKITLRYAGSTDTLNFLFSTVTDKDGYFLFSNLKEGTPYRVYYEETVNGILYRAGATSAVPNDTLRLTAQVVTNGQNGFHLTILDEHGIALKGASVCVFTSPLASGYTNNDCVGNTFALPASDVSGHTFKFSIAPGTYYLSSALALSGIQLTAKKTVDVPDDHVVFDTIRLKAPNGLKLTVLDPLGNPVAGASVCAFNSPALNGYINNDCAGSIFNLPASNAAGQTASYAIPPGTYYISSALTLPDFRLTAKDTLVVPADQITARTIRLKTPNGMKFTVLDPLDTRLQGASICVFTSLSLYQQDTCLGSNFQLTSSINGEAGKYSLPAQRYYIYCTYLTGNEIWVDRDTIDLNTDIISHTLHLRKK